MSSGDIQHTLVVFLASSYIAEGSIVVDAVNEDASGKSHFDPNFLVVAGSYVPDEAEYEAAVPKVFQSMS